MCRELEGKSWKESEGWACNQTSFSESHTVAGHIQSNSQVNGTSLFPVKLHCEAYLQVTRSPKTATANSWSAA